jgi:hypothetical protein
MIGRLYVLLIHQGRQHKGALEGAIGAFPAVVAVVFDRRREGALATGFGA